MVSLRRPSTETIREFLASQSKLGFTYTAVGATASLPPAGYVVDHTRIKLGEGEEVFTRAKAALRRWEQFRLGWVEAWSPETPIQTGEVIAVIARNFGLWWLNACRIVYVVDEAEPISASGLPTARCPIMPGRVKSGSSSNGIVRAERSGTTSWRSLARTLTDPARISIHSASPEAVRQGFGGGDVEGGRERIRRTGLMLQHGIIRSTMDDGASGPVVRTRRGGESQAGR